MNGDFKTGALNHSATLPALEFRDLAIGRDGESPNCHPVVTAMGRIRSQSVPIGVWVLACFDPQWPIFNLLVA